MTGSELYLACGECGHVWNVPDIDGSLPLRCEHCNARRVVICDDPADQEAFSESVCDDILL